MFRGVEQQKMDGWWWIGFGNPNIAVQLHPFFLLPGLASSAVGPFPLLVVLASIAWSICSGSMVALLRDRFETSVPGALAGAALYAFAPLVAVKTVAGHLAYLTAYAGLPAVLWAIMGEGLVEASLLAAGIAFVSLQVQLLAVAWILSLAFRRLRVRYAIPALILGTTAAAAHLWALLRPGAYAVTQSMVTSRPWEVNLSSPLGLAAVGLGYFEPYWPNAAPYPFGFIIPALYPLGVVAVSASPKALARWLILCTYALGAILVAGLDGPLAVPLAFAFEHISAVSAFRELYNLAVLVVISGFYRNCRARKLFPETSAWLAAVVVIALACEPWFAGRVLRQTETAIDARPLTGFLDRLSVAEPDSRFMLVPAINPVGVRTEPVAGADALALPYKSLMPLWVYLPEGFEPQYLWELARRSLSVDQRFGISAIIARTGFASHETYPYVPPGVGVLSDNLFLPEFPVERVNNAYLVQRFPDVLPLLQLTPAHFPVIEIPENTFASQRGADPRQTLAPIVDSWFSSALLARGAPTGVFTYASHAQLRLQCSNRLHVDVAVLGNGTINGRRVNNRAWSTASLDCGQPIDVSAAPRLAFTATADLRNWTTIDRVLSTPRITTHGVVRTGDRITASFPKCLACSLILAERFDPGWVLDSSER